MSAFVEPEDGLGTALGAVTQEQKAFPPE